MWIVLLLLVMPIAGFPAENGADSDQSEQSQEETLKDKEETVLDWHKRNVEAQVQRAAQWVDAFFGDPNFDAEVASSQLRVRPEIYYRDEQGAKLRLKGSLKLGLPNIKRKISFIVGTDSDNGTLGDSVDDSTDESIVGFQFFGKIRNDWHLSLSTGAKFNDFAVFVGPRARYDKALDEKRSYRFTQTVRWQTNNRWQFNSRLDLNYAFSSRYLFRQSFDGRWRGEKSDDEGYRLRLSSLLTQGLTDTAGIQYEFTTIFHSRPNVHANEYTLALRYRKRTSRDWFYYEIVPQVSFEKEFDYHANPGLRLRVEFFYGAGGVDQFKKREPEDTDDFRW